jgi:serine/threonine protein kinase
MNDLLYIDENFPSYQIIELLSSNPTSRAFLAERSDKLYVIKEQPKEFCYLKNPAFICELDCPGLPNIVDFCESNGSYYYSYEYISGVTLTEAYKSGLITTAAAVAITEKLCGIVSYLHEKWVLHCDIKPDNIIINGDNVFLIDFGLAHIYNKNGDDDTALIGTAGYFAPELGYKKTDFRSDVYAIGMVLYYLLTGSADIKLLNEKVGDRPLRAIINRSANYEIRMRYKAVEKLRRALQKYKKGTVYRPLISAILAATFVLCFIAGGLILPAVSESISDYLGADEPQIHQFSDPIIEQAIRLSLGKTADEPVYSHELLGVEAIYIVGDRVFTKSEELDSYRHSLVETGKSPLYEKFLSTSDIAACKNLTNLTIQFNAIDTIDFLSENHSLRFLELINTNVADIAVIREFQMLNYLRLVSSPVSDLSPIKDCQQLTFFTLERCPVSDLSPIKDCTMLKNLGLDDCPISDLSPIKDCTMLETITLYHINAANYDFTIPGKHYSDIAIGYVSYDKFMPNLSGITVNRLTVVDCGITSLDDFPDMTVTETLNINQNNPINTDGSERILAEGAKIVM